MVDSTVDGKDLSYFDYDEVTDISDSQTDLNPSNKVSPNTDDPSMVDEMDDDKDPNIEDDEEMKPFPNHGFQDENVDDGTAVLPPIDAEDETSVKDLPAIDAQDETTVQELPAIDAEDETAVKDLPAIDAEDETAVQDLPAIEAEDETAVQDLPAIDAEDETTVPELPAIDAEEPPAEVADEEAMEDVVDEGLREAPQTPPPHLVRRSFADEEGTDEDAAGGLDEIATGSNGVTLESISAPANGDQGGIQLPQMESPVIDDDDDDNDDDEEAQVPAPEGSYNPADYDDLDVSPELKELFTFITRYTPQNIELEHRLRPYIPDYIPAVGDIDAFIKIPRPDGDSDAVGLMILDEPSAKQSDATVLDLQLRSVAKQTTARSVVVKTVENAEKNGKVIEKWIRDISDLHRSKPPPTVHYSKAMPDIDNLMQEWPGEVEDLLKEINLPTAALQVELPQYVDLICSILDIPVYKSRVQSLHVLFTLYSVFKNSAHFKHLADENLMENDGNSTPDRLVL